MSGQKYAQWLYLTKPFGVETDISGMCHLFVSENAGKEMEKE